MRAYIAFTKKEFCEIFRSYKLLILGLVYAILGFISPLSAKFMPEIMKEFMPDGMNITMPEPTALDSYAQFFKNTLQIGVMILLILFSAMISSEIAKGTLIPLLTKGLSRRTVILSKFSAASLLYTGVYFVDFIIVFLYTVYFFDHALSFHKLFVSVISLWLFGILIIAALLFGGILIQSNFGSLLFTGAAVLLLFMINIIPAAIKYNPLFLATKNMALLQGDIEGKAFLFPVFLTVLLIMLLLFLACALFERKKL